MSRQALKKMIIKFEETGESGVLQGRGWKRLSNETAEEVALAVVERASGSQYSSRSARAMSRDLSLLVLYHERFFDPLCSITGARYCCLLQQQVIPALQELECLETIAFMQDGAPAHIVRPVQTLLRAHFADDREISRNYPTAWPPHSPDLNLRDFW
ncbi:hypothetical protein AVEN_273679-1 [Araneus ventricosus]|uniref:Tc1-like transposase DDE domain-containing protein n=1 Tax=Araneus ventricosus TaxID=182803 RepID=A0A4Y1ZR11_ARAVE|nr:hypothetical protein AVEN_273679-1 [Araneus ventricosus]